MAPYSRQAPLQIKCVATRRSQKALTFVIEDNKIHVGAYKISTMCALTDGETVYLSVKNGSDPEFKEGVSYVVKDYILSTKFGRACLFVNQKTKISRRIPLVFPEEVENMAKQALLPPSACMTGEEEDIFKCTSYMSLLGIVEKVQVVRMTRGQIPILDLSLRCGSKLHEVSLWRENALEELYAGDKVEISHLRGNIRPNGTGKFDSSNYTTVKIVERQILKADLEIIAVSEDSGDMITLVDSELEHYIVPSQF
nr:uncharacterized protein LOC129446010 [Misgurnus anguillicaudatus]